MTVEDKILKTVGTRLKDAVNWSNSNIAAKQEKALKYYKRDYLPGDEKLHGVSKYVSPIVQQRCDLLVSQLIRIFDTPEFVTEFIPFGPEDEAIARQQTLVVNFILRTKNSHLSYLHNWLQDGVLNGLGIVSVEFDFETKESLPRILKGVPDEQLPDFNAREESGQIVIESASNKYPSATGFVRDLEIRTITKIPVFNVVNVPPEDFIISADAKFDSTTGGLISKLQGHRKVMSKADLLDMGFDAEKVKAIPLASDKSDAVAIVRSSDLGGNQGIGGDDVHVYQVYTRLKLDNKTRDYRLTLAGNLDSPVCLDHEETSRYYPYAGFAPFPIAHTAFGLSVPDRVGDEHLAITRMERANMNDLNMHVNPPKVVNTDVTNLDDLMQGWHPGVVIRSADPTGGISSLIHNYTGSAVLPTIDRLSQAVDLSTGVGPSMMTLDVSDLQRTNAAAVNQHTNATQLPVEGVARFFSESGYKYLTKLVVDQLLQKPEAAQALVSRLTSGFVPNLDDFSPDFDAAPSVAFGVLTREQSSASLINLYQMQKELLMAGSPIVTPKQLHTTLAKLTEIQGYKNTGAFWIDPATLPPQPPPPPAPDPNAGLIQVETVKAQLKAQSDEADRQFQLAKLSAEMDLKRDEMAQDFALKKAEIEARYQAQIDVARLKAEQDIPRDPLGNPVPPQPIAPMQPPMSPIQQPMQPNQGMSV